MDILTTLRAKKVRRNLESLLHELQDHLPDSADDLLGSIGLQRRQSAAAFVLPALGTLVVGAAIGSALGMLFGPRYGYQLMDRIGVRIPENLREAAPRVATTSPATADSRSVLGTNHVAPSPMRPRTDIQS